MAKRGERILSKSSKVSKASGPKGPSELGDVGNAEGVRITGRGRPLPNVSEKPGWDNATPGPLHLLGLQGMPRSELLEYLHLTAELAGEHKSNHSRGWEGTADSGTLKGRVVANLFFEDSTRTRTSFSIAAKRLGGDAADLISAASSVNKGETLIDTARTVEAMGVAALVVRSKQSGVAHSISLNVACPVINAGDGKHEHPTQGLLDIFTIAEHYDCLASFNLSGLTIAIVGDVISSRVARSAIAGLTTLGATVVCVGPTSMVPASVKSLGAQIDRDMDSIVERADALMMLRIQFERAESGGSSAGAKTEGNKTPGIASVREYRERYALLESRAARMKKGAIVMHPGPMNRGIEVDGPVADGPRSVILRQVWNGVLVRMAVMTRLLSS